MRRAIIAIFLSFLTLIVIGTFLLSLPISTVKGSIPLIDAIFTSTSAVCVTGLITLDTATAFTFFGQCVILVLFQLGGLGVVTFSVLILLFLGRKISLLHRDVISSTQVHQDLRFDIRQVAKPVIMYVAISEGIGTIVLFFSFLRYHPVEKAFFHALFNSISAFCNAGFSTFSTSMMQYSDDWLVCVPLMLLIIAGGLGFVVLLDIYETVKLKKPIYLHSRIVIVTTIVLLVIGAVSFFVLEQTNALSGRPLHEQVLMSMFHSVTSRTAGFNSVDYYELTHGTLMSTLVLMFIGGSPGSTAGGIKTTTAAIIILIAIARIKRRPDTEFNNRAISQRSVVDAVTLLSLGTTVVFLVVMGLQITELTGIAHEDSSGQLMELAFEGVSAFGTVGLSMGATSHLSILGKIIICFTMFIGRLGPLTLFYVLGKSKGSSSYKLYSETVMVG